MKVTILYRPNSEHERIVTDYVHEFEQQTSHRIELTNLNTRDGSALASLYDIMEFPAVLVYDNAGQMQRVWQGKQMPLINEVSYYYTQNG